MVETIEYLLSAIEQRSFQYISVLKSLHEILKKKEIWSENQYKSFHDVTNLLEIDPTISLILYVDDFEVCNPCGTSRKKTQDYCCVLGFG